MNIKSFISALVLLGVASTSNAQTWTGGGANDLFGTGANWSGATAPTAGANLIFTGSTRLTPDIGNVNYTIGSITFDSAASSFVIGGPNNRQITLGSSVINNSANVQTFGVKLNVAGTTTFDAASGGFVFSSSAAGQNVFGIAGNAIFTGDFNTTIAATKQLNGIGEITKNGNGILTINSANEANYSGAVTVNSGTLRANNATGSATGTGTVTVNGGVFEGFGAATGPVVVNTGGTLSGGSGGVGALSIGSGTFNGGGTLRFDITEATGLEGINWDLLNIAGGLTIASSLGDQFNIDINGNPADFDNNSAYQWRIASATGGITGFDPSAFNILTGNFGGDPAGGTFFLTLANGDQDLFLNFAPVPEPSTIALGALGGIALIFGAIRRRK